MATGGQVAATVRGINPTLCFPQSHGMLPTFSKVLICKEGKSQIMGPATGGYSRDVYLSSLSAAPAADKLER